MNCGILFSSVGVQLATEVFQASIYLVRLAVLCALEKAVLGEVGNAELVCKFITTARIYHQRTSSHTALGLAMHATDAVRKLVYIEFVIQTFNF